MNVDFSKNNGLVPVIIQDNYSNQVLMLGYMNEKALTITRQTQRVTFFSRTRNSIWIKGETSGNFLNVIDITIDCDNDTLLIHVRADGPTCHNGTISCFGDTDETARSGFLYELEKTVAQRIDDDDQKSYTNQIYKLGINKVAQKVGEEAVELIIEAKDNNLTLFENEAADLLYHFLILLKAKNTDLSNIEKILRSRS